MNDPITHYIWRDNILIKMTGDQFGKFKDKAGDVCLFKGVFYKAGANEFGGDLASYAMARFSDVPAEFKAALLIEGITHD